jgi:hypothetical protein
MRKNVNAILEQKKTTGQPMFAHVNHPNFGWGITAEEMAQVEGERFFEIYNGHPAVRNEGDANHASTERMWDIILSKRLGLLGLDVVYGIATDDSHDYHVFNFSKSNSGRGWIMVQSNRLTADDIVIAIEDGDFYASSGVTLRRIKNSGKALAIEISAETGVEYTTSFIGTKLGFDSNSTPVLNAAGEKLRVTHRYSDDVGEILATVSGTTPSYKFSGNEIYVRAVVSSTKVQSNPYKEGEIEKAWIQPTVLNPKTKK